MVGPALSRRHGATMNRIYIDVERVEAKGGTEPLQFMQVFKLRGSRRIFPSFSVVIHNPATSFLFTTGSRK